MTVAWNIIHKSHYRQTGVRHKKKWRTNTNRVTESSEIDEQSLRFSPELYESKKSKSKKGSYVDVHHQHVDPHKLAATLHVASQNLKSLASTAEEHLPVFRSEKKTRELAILRFFSMSSKNWEMGWEEERITHPYLYADIADFQFERSIKRT